MRVAAQEGLAGTAQEANGSRSSGGTAASAGGAFFALLALLQNGGATGEVAATPGAPDAIDLIEGEPSDASDDPAGESAEAGVVVSLSVAANAAAAGVAIAGVAQAAGAAAPEGTSDAIAFAGPQGGKSGPGAKAFAGIAGAVADSAASASAGAGVDDALAAATDDVAAAATGDGKTAGTAAEADVAASARAAQSAVTNGDPAKAVATSAARTRHAAHDGAPAAHDGARQTTTATGATPATQANARAAIADGGAAEQGTATEAAHGVARRALDAVRPEPRVANEDGDDAGDAAGAEDAFGSSSAGTGSGATRELPAGVRVLSEPLPLQSGQADGARHAADASLRADALGAARSDATAAASSGNGAARLRASGFARGEAGLPSWVERLASPEGLAATRRGNTLHLDLEPNGLGRIELRLTFGRDGVRASVLTEHEHTRTLLASQQPQLAAALERNDVRLESFLVDVGAQSGGDGREAGRDATDPAAFDRIGLVHTSTAEPVLDETATPTRGLVNVRA